jgi:hypothetical protein
MGLAGTVFCQENKMVRIILNFSPLYGNGNMEIYNDTYNRLSPMMDNLSKARRINVRSLVKEALPEGRYTIDIYEHGAIIQSYIVFNSENVYDKTNNYYLKSNVLNDIYRIFIHYLLRDRIDTNL